MPTSAAGRLYQLYWPTFFLFAWALTSGGGTLTPWLLVNLASWPLPMALSVIAHEAGHAVVGVAMGFAPFRIRLGGGPLLKELALGDLKVELRHLPMAGMVLVSTRTLFAMRVRMWLLYAGGPLATAGLSWLAFDQSGGLRVAAITEGLAPWELLGFVNVLMLIISLYPGHIGGMATDGRNLLLMIPWVPIARFESLLIMRDFDRASVALAEHDFATAREVCQRALMRLPTSEHVRFQLATIDLMEGKVADARPIFTEFLAHSDPQAVALSKNNLAWGAFLERKADDLAEALTLSEAAVQVLPHSAAFQGTRGAVLYWAGRDEEARALLCSSFETSEKPQAKAFSACVLSMVCCRSGDLEEGVEWLARAERLDPRCMLLKEARSAQRAEPIAASA